MRTTIDLPPELCRKAKAHAAARGETLKTFLTRAVAAELGGAAGITSRKAARVELPIFGDPAGLKVDVTSGDIARALADGDVPAPRHARRRGHR